MAKPLQLRCKTKSGQHYLTALTLNSSVLQLKEAIFNVTGIAGDRLKVLLGYPPRTIDLTSDSCELSNLPFRSGDTLIIEENASAKKPSTVDSVLHKQFCGGSGILTRRVVPANNSCLFTSVYAVMNNGTIDLTYAQQMRELIAGFVLSDPVTYSDVFLGRSNSSYCKWIMKEDSWGGGIELSILSKYYGVEIDVVDTQSGRIDRFGEDQYYKKRVLLIYDGIHYDPLVYEPTADPSLPVQTIFLTTNDIILQQAMEIADEAKTSRQFTDVANFSLRCLVCQTGLKGQAEAQTHAAQTGHINFGEFRV